MRKSNSNENDGDLNPEERLREYFRGQAGPVAWKELDKFFARGVVLEAGEKLTLVDVAAALAGDDTGSVSKWLDEGLLTRVSDEQAGIWFEQDADVFAVVVDPWVVVKKREK